MEPLIAATGLSLNSMRCCHFFENCLNRKGWIGGVGDRSANNEVACTVAKSIGRCCHTLLVANGRAARTDAGNNQYAGRASDRAQAGDFAR